MCPGATTIIRLRWFGPCSRKPHARERLTHPICDDRLSEMKEILVSIAAYRDPELVPTVEDCLAKAAHPGRLRFGICWQHGPEEAELPWSADRRFRILEPLLTTYGTPYDPQSQDPPGGVPMQMNFDGFTNDGIPIFRPGELHAWQTRTQPARARFVSAHFLFSLGAFVEEVPYDPSLYFVGEEITLAARAFTHGYDLFHPTEIIVWHEYSREYRPHKHWTDHTDANNVAVAWHHREQLSVGTVRASCRGRGWVRWDPAPCGVSRITNTTRDSTFGLEPSTR